jgi:sugar lactone lactonase YvrE
MQRTTKQSRRFVRISFMGLAIFAAGGLLHAASGEEKPLSKDQEAAKKADEEVQRQQQLINEQIEAEQKALEKQLREDPAWQPTHAQVGVIRVSPKPKSDFVHCFCLDAEGNLLVGCGGKREHVEADTSGKMVVRTESDPNEVRIYTPEGVLTKTLKVGTVPQAIAVLPDGTAFIAGDGKVEKLLIDGNVHVAMTPLPSLAEKKPAEEAEKKDKTKSDNPKEKKSTAKVSIITALGEATGVLVAEREAADNQGEDAKAQAAAMEQYRRIVTGLAVTDTEVFVVSLGSQGWGYSVWRMDHDLKHPKEIITGLTGCCGQMDIQAAGGDLWIPENGRHRVTRYDRDGKKLASFGKRDRKAADGFGGCCEPKNLAIGPGGDIFTAESGEPVVVKRFSSEGKFQNVVAIPKYKTGCVHVCVAASQDGRIFILNPGESTIHVFADQRKVPTHQFLRKIGIPGDNGAQVRLNSFCLDSKGRVLAACTGLADQGNIHVMSPEGKLQATWKLDFVPEAINHAADGVIYAGGSGKLAKLAADGKVLQEAKLPSDRKPLPPEEEKKLREELKSVQADYMKAIQEYQKVQMEGMASRQEVAKIRKKVDATKSDDDKAKLAQELEQAVAETNKTTEKLLAAQKALRERVPALQKVMAQLPSGNRGTVTGIAATNRDLFVCRMPDVGYGYEVWRTDLDFGSPKKIITGLSGCCGQMDLQADGDELWIPENGRHQVHRYDRDGKILSTFGKNDRSAIDGFGGCCEPKNIRIVGDEIFTAESTQPVQVKHFSKDGRFQGIVAVPTYKTGCVRVCIEVSADKKHVFTLSPGENSIYVYEKSDATEQKAVAVKPQEKDDKCKE